MEKEDDAIKGSGITTGCINPYPLCCRDNPNWQNDQQYENYLELSKIGYNCHPDYDSLSQEAKQRFKTKKDYYDYIKKEIVSSDGKQLCAAHVCKPKNDKYCRGIMGYAPNCEILSLLYSNSLEFSYVNFDTKEDFAATKNNINQGI